MSNNEKKGVSTALKELRAERNLTQQQLADNLGVSLASILAWENDLRTPRGHFMDMLCDYFNVDLNFMYGYSEVRNSYRSLNNNAYTVSIFNRSKLRNNGNDLSKTNKDIFDTNEQLFTLELPKNFFKKNTHYFGICSLESNFQAYGINVDDVVVFSSANSDTVENNKIVCALLKNKIEIVKFVKGDDEHFYLYKSLDDNNPLKVKYNDKKEVIIGQLACVISNKQ